MELKKLYGPDNEFALVEPDSQAEEEFKAIGYSEKKPKEKKPAKKAD